MSVNGEWHLAEYYCNAFGCNRLKCSWMDYFDKMASYICNLFMWNMCYQGGRHILNLGRHCWQIERNPSKKLSIYVEAKVESTF